MKEIKFQEKREDFIQGIDDEFQDLASQLRDMDFSTESKKDFVLNTTLKSINNQGVSKIKKTGIVAASLLIASTLVAQTSFAQEAVEKILKISLGHVTMAEFEKSEQDERVLPDSLKGKVFDKNKNAIEKLTKDSFKDGMYTQDGEKIAIFDPENGIIETEKQVAQSNKQLEDDMLVVTDSSTLNEYTCFDVKLPVYLPDGYTFDTASLYKGETGNVKDEKNISLFFKNKTTGKNICIGEGLACDENRTEGQAIKIEKININGTDAILLNDMEIDWEDNNTIYMLLFGKDITRDEAIKIAESIK